MANSPINLIVDCDPGHDDALALFVAHQYTHLLGITTVAGNAPLTHTTNNALAVVELMGSDIPVHSGCDRPLNGIARHAAHVHGQTGFAGAELPHPKIQVRTEDAVSYLLEASSQYENLWIAPIGPLTNIATALQRDPEFARRIAGLSIMGGSATTGNSTPVAEFNIWADPEAAAIVFASGAVIKMCGLNLTRQFKTDDGRIDALNDGSVGQLVKSLYAFMHTRMLELTGERRAALHDPCAILALSHPELFRFTAYPVQIEVEGTITRGMTVVDQRPSADQPQANAQVGMHIDDARAWALVAQALNAYP